MGCSFTSRANKAATACAAAIAIAACGPAARATVRVVTTTPGLADITRQIGGERVDVDAVMRGPEDVHNVQAKPSHMMMVKRADLFVHSGLDGEAWASLLVKGARNAKLLPGGEGNVDVSRGIALKDVPRRGEATRALGDIHAYGNTHYMLDPLNGIVAGRTITDALKRADPAHADDYESGYNDFADRMKALTDRLVARMKPYAGTKLVIYHRAWSYFLDRFGLVAIDEIEPKPGVSPGPQHLSECVDHMKAAGARVIIVETYNNLSSAESVAARVEGRAIVLAQEVKAVAEVDTYEKLFEYNIDTLIAALDETDSAGAAGE